jgi:Cu-Zn family superoxide dismutase
MGPFAVQAATATLEPAGGSKVKGQVTFLQDGNRIRATGEITGLAPGRHGLQVHDKADCSEPGSVASNGADRQAGNLGELNASGSGMTTVNAELTGVSLASLMGKGLSVQPHPRDGKSGADGAGRPVACGVVK